MLERKIKEIGRLESSPYFKHLYHIISRDNPDGEPYHFLMKKLYKADFYSFVPNDDNRERDGEELRYKFIDEHGAQTIRDEDTSCSVLEMLLGLAYRMEDMLIGEPFAMTASECFWLFLENLDMDWMDDHAFVHHNVEAEIDEKIDILVRRRYERSGRGGIFPLTDQKRSKENRNLVSNERLFARKL